MIHLLNCFLTFLTCAVIFLAAVITLPSFFGMKPCIVLSGSMHPVFDAGSIVYIDTNDTSCEVGDIVAYRLSNDPGSMLVTHRIVRKQKDAFVTKGDANDTEDLKLLYQEQIVGTYRCHIPKLGFLAARLTLRAKLTLIIWIILLNAAGIVIPRYFDQSARMP